MDIILLYIAVFLGVFMEGEVALVTACLTAQNEKLNIYIVAIIAFIGTLAADWFCFFSGKILGEKIYKKYPKLQKNTAKPKAWIHQYPVLLLFAYRYLYGFRIVTLIILGVSDIPLKKFIPLSLISISIWVTIFTILGYQVGELINKYIIKYESVAIYFFSIVFTTIILVVGFQYLKQRKKK